MVQKSEKIFASIDNPLIFRVMNGFESDKISEVKAIFDNMKETFILSNKFAAWGDNIVLWIEGYNLSDDKEIIGNFAKISLNIEKFLSDGMVFIEIEPIQIEKQFHPKLRRKGKSLPDNGHWLLRRIAAKKLYHDKVEAMQDLAKLCDEYPNAAKPIDNGVSLLIYDGKQVATSRAMRCKILIEPANEKGFYIKLHKQEKNMEGDKFIGDFTSKVLLRQKKSKIHKKFIPKEDDG